MKEIGKQLDYVQRQIQEVCWRFSLSVSLSLARSLSSSPLLDCFGARASCLFLAGVSQAPAWIERAEDLERRGAANPDGLNSSKQMRKNLQARIRERTYALDRYCSWRSKGGGRNSFPDHELHWVVAMFSRTSKKDQETAQAVKRSTWFNSDGSVRRGPLCHRGCANAATCNGGAGCSVYIDACKTFGEGSEKFCRHILERGPFLQQSKFSPLNDLLRQFPDGVPADYPLPELAGRQRKNTCPFADCMGFRLYRRPEVRAPEGLGRGCEST